MSFFLVCLLYFHTTATGTQDAYDHQMYGGFPPTPSNSVTPAGWHTIQLSSDTIYLEVAPDPTV